MSDSGAQPVRQHVALTSSGNAALFGIAVLIVSYAVNAMDRALFPLILPEVAREYRFALPEAGLMSTVFTVGMAVSGMPAGYLMSRFAPKSVAQAGLLIFSAATIVTVYASGFSDMLAFRALTGVGEAMQLTALLAIVSGHFAQFRGAAVGALNCSFGAGAILGPLLGAALLTASGSWRVPMIGFGLIGFALMALVALAARDVARAPAALGPKRAVTAGGEQHLLNRNTVLLVLLSCLAGLAIFGFLGMYPTYLRRQLHFSAGDAGGIMSIYGLGVLVSVGGGWLGDRFEMRLVLGLSFLVAALIGFLLFNGPADFAVQAALAFAFGVIFSGAIYVNLAACHVKALQQALSGRASGVFVTSFYAAASVAGYAIGWLAATFGWAVAGDLQLCASCLVAVLLVLALKPERMARPA